MATMEPQPHPKPPELEVGMAGASLDIPSQRQSDTLSHRSDVEEGLRPPSMASSTMESWKYPRINLWRYLASNYSFIILGLNDAAYGALIPYLEKYYDVSYTVVSLVFLSPLAGYVTSALINNTLHVRFGQRGIAFLSPAAHLLAYVVVCVHPPYPVLIIAFIFAGFGNGLADAAWNAWIGGMANANELLGVLHACYGLGATLAPTVATSLITKANWKWYQFYYLAAGAAFLELCCMTATFWGSDAKTYRDLHPVTELLPSAEVEQSANKFVQFIEKHFGNSRTADALRSRVTWVCAIFISIYVGAEVGLGGWIVTFMMRVRHGSAFASGMSATGFWLGLTVGRIVLGFVTPRLFKSEKHAVIAYLLCTMVVELLFWLVPKFIVSAVMISLVGFFLGPLFPIAVVAATKLLPKHLHVAAIGFAAAIGASGATALPFAVGAIAQSKGVQILQPFILAILVACLGVWLFLPSLSKKKD